MKILILTCSTGEGHNSASSALCEEAKNYGIDAEVTYFPSLVKEKDNAFISKLYNWMINKTPKLFGFIYLLNKIIDKSFIHKWAYFISSFKAKELYKYIKDGSYDCVIASQIYPMLTLTKVKKKYMNNLLCYGLMTDYTYIPYTKDVELDKYFIAHKDLIELFEEKGLEKEKLYPTGIPVKESFKTDVSKNEARKLLNINLDKKIYLIMSGGSGSGKVLKLCDEILNTVVLDSELYVLAGKNKKLKELLEKKFSNFHNLKVVEFTKEINLYMRSSDVIITKPGGLSSTETGIMNIPLVHILAMKGCEEDNAKFFEKHHMSVYAKSVKEAACLAQMLIDNTEVKEKCLMSQKENINQSSSKDIINIILSDYLN